MWGKNTPIFCVCVFFSSCLQSRFFSYNNRQSLLKKDQIRNQKEILHINENHFYCRKVYAIVKLWMNEWMKEIFSRFGGRDEGDNDEDMKKM